MKRSSVVGLTGSLPLGARQSIKADFLEGRDAARRGDVETRDRYARTLGRFALGHGLQVGGGLLYGAVNAYLAVRQGSEVNAVAATYDGIYALVNGGVTYTQAYLARSLRATPVGPDSDLSPVGDTNHDEPRATYDRAPTRIEELTLLLGQGTFVATVAIATADIIGEAYS